MIWGNPCHLSCWINLIYRLNDLPAQFGRVTSNVNHFSFQKIRMIGMPFKTWLLDLTFENDVTCFGNRFVMNCFSFQPGSGQYMPNTSKYPNHLSSQISTGWMHLEINVHCIAFCHFPTVTFIRRCLDPSFLSWSHPCQTPSLRPFISDHVSCQIQLCQSGVVFQDLGQSLARDKRSEKHNEANSAQIL